MRMALVMGLAGILAGCSVGPKYERPPALSSEALPNAFTTAAQSNAWKTAEPSAHLPRPDGWKLFGDAELTELETLASNQNQDLAAAAARFNQARAAMNVARSEFFPHLTANPAFARQRTSFNAPEQGHAAGQTHTFNTFSFPLELGWEIDLWGRVRRQTEAAKARFTAAADDVESAKLLLQAEVATDYFTLRALESEVALLENTVEAYRRSLELTQNRRKGGIASDLDVSQAETQLRTIETDLPALRLQRSKLLHALATLCGQPATNFQLPMATNGTAATPALAVSVPSELLERRPDIASAERHMAAANAEVGVAKSAFYPRVRFNGLAGLQSIDGGALFDWPSRFWAVGPSLELPLFTGGRNRAQLSIARAAYDENVSRYRQTVLTAFQEVEDALAAEHFIQAQIEAESAALQAARRTLEIAANRYHAGLVTYLEVATAQTTALNRERALAQLRGEQLVAAVTLVKALGGGWESQREKLSAR